MPFRPNMGIRFLTKGLLKITVVAGAGLVGYYIGKSKKNDPKEITDIFSLKDCISPVLAASVIHNENVPSYNLPDVTKDIPPSAGSENRNVENAVTPNRISEIMKYGFPSLDNIRSYGNFVLSYDKRNRVAHWVFEHLTKETVKRNNEVDRTSIEFFEDESIHPFFRATNADYKRSGYDRGHLAAAGNHKSNQETCKKTFILTNMAPQVGEGFNRSIWNKLEKHVRKLARKYENVYVCTGPLYLPRIESDGRSYVKYQVIGKNTVAVPTHFFKVIVMEDGKHNLEMESYVMPNEVIPDNISLQSFQVPVESIERASGLLLFDKIHRKSLKRINGK